MKVVILVLSYNDYGLYTNFYKTQKETWDSLVIEDVETFYYFGGFSENYIKENVIYLDVKESLQNCGLKTIEAFKLLLEKKIDFDYIFRTNSSSYIDKILLKKFLEGKPKNKFYCGILGEYNNHKFCSGSGFFLSKDLVELIISNQENINLNFIDDVALGVFLSSQGVELIQSERLDVLDNSNIPLSYFHYRLKTDSRTNDINNMKSIFNQKCNLLQETTSN